MSQVKLLTVLLIVILPAALVIRCWMSWLTFSSTLQILKTSNPFPSSAQVCGFRRSTHLSRGISLASSYRGLDQQPHTPSTFIEYDLSVTSTLTLPTTEIMPFSGEEKRKCIRQESNPHSPPFFFSFFSSKE